MSVITVGFSPWETLPANSLMRLTFGQQTHLGVRADPFDFYTPGIRGVYDALYSRARIIPIIPLPVTDSTRVSVIDGTLKDAMRGADVIAQLEQLADDNRVQITRVERLTGSRAAAATTDEGARERQDIQTNAAKVAEGDTIFAHIAELFGSAKWIAIAVVVIIAAYFVATARRN